MRKHKPIPPAELGKVWKTIDSAPDLETVVLKGHLMIEYFLSTLVIKLLPDGKKILDRFPYLSQKLVILDGAGVLGFPIITEQIEKLNSIRNDISHELIPTGLEQMIMSIPASDVYGYFADYDETIPRDRLIGILHTVSLQLANWSDPAKHDLYRSAMA